VCVQFRDANNRSRPYNQNVDWFAFGCVLFEMRVGHNPFRTSAALQWAKSFDRQQRRDARSASEASQNSGSSLEPTRGDVVGVGGSGGVIGESNDKGNNGRHVGSGGSGGSGSDSSGKGGLGSGGARSGGKKGGGGKRRLDGSDATDNTGTAPTGTAGGAAAANGSDTSPKNNNASGPSKSSSANTQQHRSTKASPKQRINNAVMWWDVIFTPELTSDLHLQEDFVDLCRGLLAKKARERLGSGTTDDIAEHSWFMRCVDLEGLQDDTCAPPFAPGRDIHTCSQRAIGNFEEDLSRVYITEEDDEALRSWNFSSSIAFNREIITVLKHEESMGPITVEPIVPGLGSGCCSVS
jgi:hypothetical protein